jgi:molybdopterin-guanine dinucleotide biosynthesis protein A
MLLRASAGPGLRAFLEGGGRKVDRWFAQLRVAQADFSDEPDCFANVNEPDERQRLEARLVSLRVAR